MPLSALPLLWCLTLGAPDTPLPDQLPAGTELQLRLQQMLSSYGSDPDTPVSALVIAPVEIHGRVVVPLGAEVLGRVDARRRVGLGLSRETAYLDLTFDAIVLADGTPRPMRARVWRLDNARETVEPSGRIRGIRATASASSMLSSAMVSIGFVDPMLLAFTVTTSLSAFRIPESEIILPAGAELRLRLTDPLAIDPTAPEGDRPLPPAGDAAALATLVRGLPYRTFTESSGQPSDVTNLVFLASRDALARSFDAAGWSNTDPRDARSTYGALRAVVENQGYQEAPMSTLLLNGATPVFTYAKTLNTFFERHHLRIFSQPDPFEGLGVWTSSSTHDSGIGIDTASKRFIHLIDENIDEERAKVVHDLVLTGCVTGLSFVDRPWIPKDLTNSTGDHLLTDGRAAVIRLDACDDPVRADTPVLDAPEVRERPGGTKRVFRDLFLTLKNDMFRGNIVYQGYSVVRRLVGTHAPDPLTGARTLRFGGQEFKIVRQAVRLEEPLAEDIAPPPSFDPIASPASRDLANHLEFALSGGSSEFGNSAFSTQPFDIVLPPDVGTAAASLLAETSLGGGWSLAPTVTLNTNRFVSHEFGYAFNRTNFRAVLRYPDLGDIDLEAPARIRQFSYNVLVHARPNGARVRPYFAIGPGMQLIRLNDSVTGGRGVFRYGFKTVGVLAGAWDFGRKPPLEGGGIFQGTLQYGGGVKIALSSHVLMRLDFRETLSKQPDFFSKSYGTLGGSDPDSPGLAPGTLVLHGPLRHQRFSIGFGVGF